MDERNPNDDGNTSTPPEHTNSQHATGVNLQEMHPQGWGIPGGHYQPQHFANK